MRILLGIIIIIVLEIIVGIIIVFSGVFNVAATSADPPGMDWILNETSDRSVDARSGSVHIASPNTAALVPAGATVLTVCTTCHDAPGKEASLIGKGLNPDAPDLDDVGRELTPQQIFWVTQNGIKMTGMPSFGKSYNTNAIAAVSYFVKDLGTTEKNGKGTR